MSCSRTQRSDAGAARNPRPLGLESSTLPLSHCVPLNGTLYILRVTNYDFKKKLHFFLGRSNSVGPDEMTHYEAFHLGLHYSPK